MNKSMIRYLVLMVAAFTVAMIASPVAQATTLRNRTTVEFTEPIQVPGAVLSPGKYVFQLEASLNNRNIVHIFQEKPNSPEKEVATVMAIPNERLETKKDTVLTTYAVPKEGPKILKAWFAPSERYGRSFVYSKEEALKIARRTGENVPVTKEGSAEYLMTPKGDEVEMGHQSKNGQESMQSASNGQDDGMQ